MELIELGVHIAKAINAQKQELTCVVLRPDVVDLHGDIYSAEEVEKACRNFNLKCMKGNVAHEEMSDSLIFVESYIAPADFKLGDGNVLKADWVATMRVVDPKIWKSVEDGSFTGLSIACNAATEKLEA